MARWIGVWLAVWLAALAGCADDRRADAQPAPPGDAPGQGTGTVGAVEPSTGAVGMTLTLAPGVDVLDVAYTIQGPRAYAGTVRVGGARAVAFTIGGIEAGRGYVLTLAATDSAGDPCSGTSAPFDVAAGAVTSVALAVRCVGSGTIGVGLTIPPGTIIPVVQYVVEGPAMYAGTVVVDATTSVEFVIGGILAGAGYTLTLTASDTAGDSCSGTSSAFDVIEGASTSVPVLLTCVEVSDAAVAADVAAGSAEIDASVVLEAAPPVQCPGISLFSIDPSAAAVGQPIALSLGTVGPPPAITWQASPAGAGVFSPDGASADVTFTCSTAGLVTLTVTVDSFGGGCAAEPFTTMSGGVRCE